MKKLNFTAKYNVGAVVGALVGSVIDAKAGIAIAAPKIVATKIIQVSIGLKIQLAD